MKGLGTDGELHLLIIWERGRYKQNDILADIEAKFKILDCYEVEWSDSAVASNFTRFYGVNLPDGSFKEAECGRGKFLLVILFDENPVYETRMTSRGSEKVNSTMFDSKALYRSWTGGGHKIHATNNPKETNHDLSLLLGISYDDYLRNLEPESSWGKKIKSLKRDIVGSDGWKSLEEFFYILNGTIDYVVLRNYEYLPGEYKSSQHGDIDLLVGNFENAKYIANATPVFAEDYRVHCYCTIGGERVFFDFRYVGDNYYCEKWEKHILCARVLERNCFYVPCETDYKYSLLYHALLQKPKLTFDYKQKLSKYFDSVHMGILENFFDTYGYEFVCPSDSSVFYLFRLKPDTKQTIRRFKCIYPPPVFKHFARPLLLFWERPLFRRRNRG